MSNNFLFFDKDFVIELEEKKCKKKKKNESKSTIVDIEPIITLKGCSINIEKLWNY